jgi:hypothetical protein
MICVMGLKIGWVLILWLGLEMETPKSNQYSLEFGTTFMCCLLLILLIRCGYIHSSDILSIRFKHTRILRIFGLFLNT